MQPGLFDVPWADRASGAGKTRKTHGGECICDVCVLHNQSFCFIGGTLLQLETPSGHIWNVFTWCPIKLSWKSISLKCTRFIIFCAFRSYGNIIPSGSRFLEAKSCESIVSVVPVRFAFLETLFLYSEIICRRSGKPSCRSPKR